MKGIYKKELLSYFTSMIGYVYIGFFLIMIGIYFTVYNLNFGYADFSYTLQGVAFLFVVLTPILTMRTMAEEKKQKTYQLLLTSPVTSSQIVIGKYLAVLTVFLMGICVICTYPIILNFFGDVNMKLSYAGILGFTLMGAAYLSLGMFISSITENQVIAAVVGFVVMLVTYLMPGFSTLIPADGKTAIFLLTVMILVICIVAYLMMKNATVVLAIGFILEGSLFLVYFLKPEWLDGAINKIMSWFSIIGLFDSFIMGNIDLTAIVYYLSVIFIFVFLCIQSLRKQRWN